MDFFESQQEARRRTTVLVVYYVLAVICIVVAVYVAAVAVFTGVLGKSGGTVSLSSFWLPDVLLWAAVGTLGIVGTGTLYKIAQLRAGGEMIALSLGGQAVNANTADADERKVLNVVEEMAIASGTAVPRVFVLEEEEGINAFAAGLTPGDAVIGVTRGCIERLTRDELQGVIAHEFSHILNGDMRLNLRLIGVLNGILLIAMIGYQILRFTGRSSSRVRTSREKGGGNAPILLFGVALLAIGYIGVFFGKLIKSAVSRQREFLADASAVQFTRNPMGIGNALRKIAGYIGGSRVESPHAEEASHFFFANALQASFLNLMATHPPVEERIRRIDPSLIDSAQPAAGDIASPPLASRRAEDSAQEATSGFLVNAAQVTASVGAPQPAQLEYATNMLARLPAVLLAAVREPFSATATVYALLTSRDDKALRDLQVGRLTAHAAPAVVRETLRLAPVVAELPVEARLPLAEVAISALKGLSPAQFQTFRSNVEVLVTADEQVDLFEYTLHRMILRRLASRYEGRRKPVAEVGTLEPLIEPLADVLSCLAYWGTDDAAEAERSFAAGAAKAWGKAGPSSPRPLDRCGLPLLDQGLEKLAAASSAVKRTIIEAVTACIALDGRVTIEEAELLRAVGDALDCPIPPFVAGQSVRSPEAHNPSATISSAS